MRGRQYTYFSAFNKKANYLLFCDKNNSLLNLAATPTLIVESYISCLFDVNRRKDESQRYGEIGPCSIR
jgi:hypothetical protein